jgi:prolyl oligopeptidase PreP (S9A serine peptidase family)
VIRRVAYIIVCAAAAVGAAIAADTPRTEIRPVTDVIHGVPFVDPYRWLEAQDAPEVRRWIDAQNAHAEAVLSRTSDRAGYRQSLRRLMDRPDIGPGRRGGGFEYFTLRRPGEEQAAIVRRPTPATPTRIDPSGTYERLIDPASLSPGLTTSLEVLAVTATGDRLIYAVRDGGQDERELVVRDLKTMQDVERFPNALYDGVTLRQDGTGFYYVRRSRESGARVRSHAWGAPSESDTVIFGDGYGPTAFVSMAATEDQKRFLFTVQHGWARSEVWLQEGAGRPQPVIRDVEAHVYPRVVRDELWMRTNLDAPMGRLVAVDLTAPSNRSTWRTVIPEQPDVLEDFTVVGDRVYAMYLRDVSSRILVFDRQGTRVGEIDLPDRVSASVRAEGDEALLAVESFTAPEATYRLDADGTRTLSEPPWLAWDARHLRVDRVSGRSKDGTRVPIFVVGRADRPRDGSHRTLLFGYGGFTASQKPRFSGLAAAWIESGGVYAMAILRGGNEFGEPWHRAGMLTSKQNVFDDFIAAGEALIASGETSSDRLAILGTSNGGLLVGAAMTQRPDLFRVVLCGFPDVDILRFNQYTRTNNMPALLEYGNAAIPEQFEAIRRFSLSGRDDLVRRSRYAGAAACRAQVHCRAPGGDDLGPPDHPSLSSEGRPCHQQRPAVFPACRNSRLTAGLRQTGTRRGGTPVSRHPRPPVHDSSAGNGTAGIPALWRAGPRVPAVAVAVALMAASIVAQFDPAAVDAEPPAIAAQFPDPPVSYRTPGLADRRDFASAAEAAAFAHALASAFPARVHVETIGWSQEGRAIVLIRLAGDAGAAAVRPTILILGQQHGNEPAGGEAALAVAAELAGPRRALLDRATVLIVPRANPDGADRFARTTASGLDVNRDHLLLQTPEARALALVASRDRPHVVLDLHEFTVGERWVRKFNVVQRYDVLLQAATVGNLSPIVLRLADREFLRPIRAALDGIAQRSFTYHTTSQDPTDRVVSMGGVQPDTGRNVNGLRQAVSLLLETRGVGIGRAHFARRVHAHVTAVLAAIDVAGRLGPRLVSDLDRAGARTAAAACTGSLVIDATLTPTRQSMQFLDAATGAARRQIVDWRAANPLRVVRQRSRPCGYLLASNDLAVDRLHALGVATRAVVAPGAWRVERYDVDAVADGERQDARGAIDDGTSIRLVRVRTTPTVARVEAGQVYVDLAQPLGGLIAAALEPDSQNSFVASRLLELDAGRLLRVVARPPDR